MIHMISYVIQYNASLSLTIIEDEIAPNNDKDDGPCILV